MENNKVESLKLEELILMNPTRLIFLRSELEEAGFKMYGTDVPTDFQLCSHKIGQTHNYDFSFGQIRVFPILNRDWFKNPDIIREFLVLKTEEMLFNALHKARLISSRLMQISNGIGAYSYENELRTNEKIADNIIEKYKLEEMELIELKIEVGIDLEHFISMYKLEKKLNNELVKIIESELC